MDPKIASTIVIALAVTAIIFSARKYFKNDNTKNNQTNTNTNTKETNQNDESIEPNTNHHTQLQQRDNNNFNRSLSSMACRSSSSSSEKSTTDLLGELDHLPNANMHHPTNKATIGTITIRETSETTFTFGNSPPITITENSTKHIDIPLDLAWSPLSTKSRNFASIEC